MDAREETKRRIAVMQAWVDGKAIEVKDHCLGSNSPWQKIENPDERPAWDWATCDYRIAPEPKVIWVNEYPDGSWGTGHATQADAEVAAIGIQNVRTARFAEQPE